MVCSLFRINHSGIAIALPQRSIALDMIPLALVSTDPTTTGKEGVQFLQGFKLYIRSDY